MAIDYLNAMSAQQLMALSMSGNGQLTSESTGEAADYNNLAFSLLMQNLINEQKKSSSQAITENGEGSDKIIQQVTSGKNLEDLQIRLNNYSSFLNLNNSNGVSSVNLNSNDETMKKIYSAVETASKKYGVDANLILAVIKNESSFNPNVTSGVGAQGLMQVMPANFNHTGITNGYDIDQNVNGGTRILKDCLNQYNGDVQMALMAYGAGSGTMQKRGVTGPQDLYKMPEETKIAVPRVMSYYNDFKNTASK